ncbi:hypothetical protein OF83DRAFT_1048257 [Amylostereum chailletii]|nr:hypothetical protein OF83DRAFT_1048257 [Amylostereum chailletii]
MLVKLRSPSQTVIVSSSGPDPLTHPTFLGKPGIERAEQPLAHVEHFICADAVEPAILLRASRTALLEHARTYGADSLVDETWNLSIRPKNGTYRVSIKYSAHPAISGVTDPRRPMALRQAQGIPGVMTIVERL